MAKKIQDIRMLLVGAGGKFGSFYLESLTSTLGIAQENIFAVDVNRSKVQIIKERYPKVSVSTSISESLVQAGKKIDCALITTNTPSHHKVIIECLKNKIQYIFVEKPLAIDSRAVNEIRKHLRDEKIFVAFIGAFSDARGTVQELMKKKKLYLSEAFMDWKKDRSSDARPTIGCLEDESVHGVMAMLGYAGINQKIQSIDIQAQVSYLPFVNTKSQKLAQKIDSGMPSQPSCTATIFQKILTEKGVVLGVVRSSFLSLKQSRITNLTLSDMKTRKPKYLIEIDSSKPKVVLEIKKAGDSDTEIKRMYFESNKIGVEIRAFLDVVIGKKTDHRLTDFETAATGVAITDASKKSVANNGKAIQVFDVVDC